MKPGEVKERLTLVERLQTKPARWLCLCSCGQQKIIRESCIQRGETRSCGCLRDELRRRPLTQASFFDRCIPEPNTGCWLWLDACDRRGYGRTRANNSTELAHRVAFELWIGPIPDGLFACHHCDTPPCCNPEHLFLGTHADNVADMVAKGRNILCARTGDEHWSRHKPELIPRGTVIPASKLNEEIVARILLDLMRPDGTRDIPKRYGIARQNITRIMSGKAWTHVPRPEGFAEAMARRERILRSRTALAVCQARWHGVPANRRTDGNV